MDELKRLEDRIIVIELHIMAVAFIYAFVALRGSIKFDYYMAAILLVLVSALFKSRISRRLTEGSKALFLGMRVIDAACIAVFMLIEGYQTPFVFFYSILILASAMAMGSRIGYAMLNISTIFYIIVFLLHYSAEPDMLVQLVIALFYILMTAFIAIFTLRIVSDYEDKQHELEQSNEQLRKTIAEFYMLQQVDTAISSILDTDRLLNTVNDVILGVVGPTYSSILLFDEEKNSLSVKASNMEPDKIKAFLENDSHVLWLCLEEQDAILKNHKFNQDFTLSDPGINSFICVPLSIRGKRCGMILVEQERLDALTEDQLRLLKIIADNLGISLENSRLYERMHKMAILDGLTQVHNRMYFQEAFEEELNKAKGKYPLSIAIGDIDNFKRINDTYGHIAGDKVLKAITSMLKDHLRQGDIIARYGGEEFVIILPGVDMNQAYNIVERLRGRVEMLTVSEEGHDISVTISFGIASYPECGWTTRELLRQADKALYQAKEHGKNQVCLAVGGNGEKSINPS